MTTTGTQSTGSLKRAVRLTRIRILKNRHGSIALFLLARRRNWWMTRPIKLGPQKVHIYGVCRRGPWHSNIVGLEITPSQIVVMKRVTHPKQPNDQAINPWRSSAESETL